jgi:hypothetical protein
MAETLTTTPPETTSPVLAAPGSWRATLPQDLQTSKSLEKFGTPADLAKSYLEAEKNLSAPKLPMPQANWTEKEYGDLYGKLGRPEKPEGYEFQPLKDLPPGLVAAPETDKWFAEQAHKAGLSKAQANAVRDQFVQFQAAQAQAGMKQVEERRASQEGELNKLRMEFGPKWDASIDGANKILEQFGGEDMQKLINDKELTRNPAFIRFTARIASILHDHSVTTGQPRMNGEFSGGPAAAMEEIRKMESDPETRKALTQSHHPKNDEMVKRRAELFKVAYPPTE